MSYRKPLETGSAAVAAATGAATAATLVQWVDVAIKAALVVHAAGLSSTRQISIPIKKNLPTRRANLLLSSIGNREKSHLSTL